MQRIYGLSKDQYYEMLKKQDNKCVICRVNLHHGAQRQPAIDHDHTTGRVRGILCHRCNASVVSLSVEALKRAIDYITPKEEAESVRQAEGQ
jgi:hypothetical protein